MTLSKLLADLTLLQINLLTSSDRRPDLEAAVQTEIIRITTLLAIKN